MGVYSEYLDTLSPDKIPAERKKQLKRFSEIRQRPVLVYASDMGKNCPNSIDMSDLVPFLDQLSGLKGDSIDIIIETPGGQAEIVEDMVRLIRNRFNHMSVFIPGIAKSAGTIFSMAADEIWMGELSALGPIDAQIFTNGKRYSADAFLEGLRKIQRECNQNQRLDIAYIPILQSISPGEIQHCENAQKFSKTLVTNWLKEYKFSTWGTHSSTGCEVTPKDREERATEIADKLCNHNFWLTHNKSLTIKELREMRLIIHDYSETPELNDTINRYYTLLRMSFESPIYKIYETPDTQVYRFLRQQGDVPQNVKSAIIAIQCGNCKQNLKIQANFEPNVPLEAGAIAYPPNNIIQCPHCKALVNLIPFRKQIEQQAGKPIII